MRKAASLLALLIIPLILSACFGKEFASPEIPEGPALIMFYLDG